VAKVGSQTLSVFLLEETFLLRGQEKQPAK